MYGLFSVSLDMLVCVGFCFDCPQNFHWWSRDALTAVMGRRPLTLPGGKSYLMQWGRRKFRGLGEWQTMLACAWPARQPSLDAHFSLYETINMTDYGSNCSAQSVPRLQKAVGGYSLHTLNGSYSLTSHRLRNERRQERRRANLGSREGKLAMGGWWILV